LTPVTAKNLYAMPPAFHHGRRWSWKQSMKNPIRITIALDSETNGLLEKIKEETKVSQSELVREALRFY